MADDFVSYQGDDLTLYFVVIDQNNTPVNISSTSAATWVATPANTTNPTILKHLQDMTISTDPEGSSATENCIFVPILAEDTGTVTGQFRHELRLTLSGEQVVVYPEVDVTATFTIVPSLTWNPQVAPPAPRLERKDLEQLEEPKEQAKPSTLKRVPTRAG